MPINKSESTKIVPLDLSGLTPTQKSTAKTKIGELLVDEINDFLDRSKSPVSGGSFKTKKKDGSRSELFESGDMRAHITFSEHPKGVKVGIFKDAPEVDKLKSQNHNLGVTLPVRQFIPKPDEKFRKAIESKINQIINEVKDGES